MTRGRGKKTPSPSKLPTPVWRRKEGKRLRRRSEGEQPDIDQSGTDHSPPISVAAQPQPSPHQISPEVQSPQFGRLDTTDYSNTSSPQASCPVSEENTVRLPVIRENPWSIFSPRPRGFDKVKSAPSSPTRAAPALLTRADSAPSQAALQLPVSEGSHQQEQDTSGLFSTPQCSTPLLTRKIPIVSTPNSSPTATSFTFNSPSSEEELVFPPPILSFFSPQRTVVESEDEIPAREDTVEDRMAEQKAQEMKKANTQLNHLLSLIIRDIGDLTEEDLDERGPDGVKEELDDIKTNQNKLQWQITQYSQKYEGVEDVPTVRGSDEKQDITFWENKLDEVNRNVRDHKRRILKKLKDMKENEKSKNEAAVREEKIQKQSKDAQSAKLKALEADHIQSRLKDMFPKVTNWQRASRQQVLEGFKLIPKIQSEFDKMLAAYHTAEKDGFGLTIPGINMDSLRNNVNTMKAKVKDFTSQVTAENDSRELRAATDGYRNNVPLPRFRGSQGEDWFTFQSDLTDAMERNNVAGPDKFDVLKSCLGGDAAKYIPMSVEKDYEAAMETLKGIYGKTVTVMKARLEELRKLGTCPDEFSPSSGKNNFQAIVTFCLKMESLLRTIRKLAKDHTELSGDIHSKLLQENIINQMQAEQAKVIKKKIKNLDGETALRTIQEFLQEYREECQDMTEHPSCKTPLKTPSSHSSSPSKFKPNHSSREFHRDCRICLQLEKRRDTDGLFIDHSSAYPTGCPRFQRMTFKERTEICSAAGLCWFCLDFRERNHRCKKTNPKIQCQKCKKHIWICQDHHKENIPAIQKFIDKFGIPVEMGATYAGTTARPTYGGLTETEIIRNMKKDLQKENKSLVDIPSGNSLFLLAELKGKTRGLLTFFDSGASDCLAKEGVPGNEVVGTLLNKGPFYLNVAGNKTVTAGDEWIFQMERTDGQFQAFRCLTLKKICNDWPRVTTRAAVEAVKNDFKSNHDLQKSVVPALVGGEVDLLMGCRYNNVYPEAIHQLASGLTIYSLKL